MAGSSFMDRDAFRVKFGTVKGALLVLLTVLGFTGSTDFESTKNNGHACWSTAWNETLPTSTSAENETRIALSEIYQDHFQQAMDQGHPITMLPSCLTNGRFSLSTETISTPMGERVYSGGTQFRLELNASLSEVDERFYVLDETPSVTIWFRVLACNIQEVGFCSPWVDMDVWNDIPFTTPIATDPPSSPNKNLTFSHQKRDGVISSPWLEFSLTNLMRGDSSLRLEALSTLNVTIPDDVDGLYEFIGHGAIHLISNEKYYRADIATALTDNPFVTVTSQANEPELMMVDKAAKIVVGVIIGVGCAAILWCFGIIVYYRNHRVMTMAQAGLLGWLTASCFFAVLLSFLVLPTRDSFCRISSLTLIPASMTASIMIGRLFRVYSTLGKAHRLGKSVLSTSTNKQGKVITSLLRRSRKAEDMTMTILSHVAFTRCFGGSESRRRRSSASLRRVTTRNDSIRLILVLSSPQIIVQIVRMSLYDGGLTLQYDDDYTTARQVCDDTGYRWARYLGLTIILLQYILCLFIAWCSRDLPAAFNETSQIFKAAIWGGVISLSIVLLQIFFDLPSTAPSITSVVNVIYALALALLMVIYIVLPKVRRVLSGKKVVVSHMLRDTASFHSFGPHTPGARPTAEQNGRCEEANKTSTSGDPTDTEAPKLVMKQDDPLPREVETEMYKLDEIIGSLKDKSLSGDAINGDELRTLKAAVASLSTQMERVQFENADDDMMAEINSVEQDGEVALSLRHEADTNPR